MFKFLLIAALIAYVTAESEDAHADTKLWKMDIRHDGWDSIIETTNHIHQAAHGDKHGNIHGDFEWVDPKGEHIAIKYVADEHGYQPEGNVIHPIPEHIVKSLEYIKTHPPYEEKEHHHGHH